MYNAGDFLEDATVYIPFNTFDSNDPSASVTITDLVASDVEVWKDGVVQTTPGAGVTITLNIGTNNGSHLIAIDTSNTTDGGFYVTGSDYQVRINGTTIDGATVNAWVGTFSTENRFMRGTDSAYTGTPPTVSQIQTELEENGASLLDTIRDELANATDGLSALKTLIDAIPTTAMRGTDGVDTTTMRGTDGAALASAYTASRAGYLDELATANLPTDVAAIPTTMVGTDNAALASAMATAQSDLDTITGGSGVLIDTDAVDADALKADAVDEIWAKAMSDLAQGAPSATASVLVAINWLYEAFRNKTLTTATLIQIMKDDGTTALAKSTISDDATTFTKDEFISGA